MRDTSFHKEKKLSAPPDQRLPRSYLLPPSTLAERALQVPLLSKAASCLEPPIKSQLILLAGPDTTWYFNTCSGGCSGGPCGQHLSCVTARAGQMLCLVILLTLQVSLFPHQVAILTPSTLWPVLSHCREVQPPAGQTCIYLPTAEREGCGPQQVLIAQCM